MWYVRAAEAGDERAKHRIAAIRAAVAGGDPAEVARPKDNALAAQSPKKSGKIGKSHMRQSSTPDMLAATDDSGDVNSRAPLQAVEVTSSSDGKSKDEKDCIIM